MPTSEEQDYFKPAHEQYHQLIKTLSADSNQGWEHGEVERYINSDGTELLRRLFQGHLKYPLLRPKQPLLPPQVGQ